MSKLLLALTILSAGAGVLHTARQSAIRLEHEAASVRSDWIAQTQWVATAQAELAGLHERVRELKQSLKQSPPITDTVLWSALQTNRPGRLASELRERLREELGFNWQFTPDYIVVSKEAIRGLQMGIINSWQGELTATAATVFALTPEERGQFEAAIQRTKMDFKEWALVNIERSGPKDDVLVQYSLPKVSHMDPALSQTISNNLFTSLLATLGPERTKLTFVSSAYNWMCELGVLSCGSGPEKIIVKRYLDGNEPRLKAQLGDGSTFDLNRGSSFPRAMRPVFPNGWADVAEREGFELPEAPPKQ